MYTCGIPTASQLRTGLIGAAGCLPVHGLPLAAPLLMSFFISLASLFLAKPFHRQA
jgi:hypothetical protein